MNAGGVNAAAAGQLSLADGVVEGGAWRDRQLEKLAALVSRAAFGRPVRDLYAAPARRRCLA